MKIRTDYVTNSSSSSYILAMKKPCKCPTCNITPPNILDYVEDKSNNSSGDYRVEAATRDGIIRMYERLISEQHDIHNRYKTFPGNHVIYDNGSFSYTVDDQKKTVNNQIADYQKVIKMVESIDKDLEMCELTIDMHDDFAKNLIEATCVVISKNEG